jgi:hypothetical protein
MPFADIVPALERERDRFVYIGAREKIRCRTLDEAIKIVRSKDSPAIVITALEAERDRIVYIGSREKIRCDALDTAIKIVTSTTATTTGRSSQHALPSRLSPSYGTSSQGTSAHQDMSAHGSREELQDILASIKRDLERYR